MSFPWLIMAIIGGALIWWALGNLGLRPTDKASAG